MTSTANIYTNDSVVGNTGFKGYTGTNNTGVNNGTNNTGVNKNIHNLSNMNPFISLLYHIKILFISFFGLFGIYIIWNIIHYVAAHLYIYLCAPPSFLGFLLSPFIMQSTHCVGLRWCLNVGANINYVMWITIGTWFVNSFVIAFGLPQLNRERVIVN